MSNIATNKLYVTSNDKSDIRYVIYNTGGTKMADGILKGTAAIDVSQFPAALYFIRFLSGDNTLVQKFVKE